MKTMISAGIVPFYEKNNTRYYLILQHAGKSPHWDFPKGKIEAGENKQQAASRELHEEAGISAVLVPDFEYSFSYKFKDYDDGTLFLKTVYFYIGKAETQQVTLSFEHQNYAWLTYKQAHEQLTYENAKNLLKQVHEFLK